MKLKINHLLFVAFIAILSSCNSDDTNNPKQEVLAETVPIAKETVFENIIVEGATKKAGAPSTPNEDVSFTLNTKNTNAVMVDGFDIEFNSNDNLVGAYLQIKDNDGNLADGFYDIDLSLVDKKSPLKNKTKSISKQFKQAVQKQADGENEISVDVDFNDTIEAGTFCYVICVYDANGNISAPQEVCITVQSWGGNDKLVGVWNYTKTENFEDGETFTAQVGDAECDTQRLDCENGSNLEYEYCYTTDAFKFTINADGTYSYIVNSSSKGIDYEASRSSCEVAVTEEEEKVISKGKWAYDQSNGQFIIVEFEYTEVEEGEEDTEIYEAGEAEVITFSSTEVDDSKLVLGEEYLDVSGAVDEWYKYYFDKE